MREWIGSFEILGELGRGATGVVYRARQASLNREVALKVLSQALADDPEYAARFHREAETAASLDHPLIVTVYDTGVADGCHYIAMRYVRGDTLESALQERPPDLPAALSIASQIAEALAYAHERGIVHRDLKPANVVITPDGKIALADFGIARAAEASSFSLEGQVFGTPEYMSPEQARGETVDGRSDIYALGMILYRMLTGRPAFVGGDPVSILYRQASEDPAPVRQVNPSVPGPLADLVHTCLAKNPAARFQSAGAVFQAIESVRQGGAPGDVSAPAVPAPEALVVEAVEERELAALSVDVVRSSQLKQASDSQGSTTLFATYRSLVHKALQKQGCLAHWWSGDGLLALFETVEAAVQAGKEIQRALPRFNRGQGLDGTRAVRTRVGVDFGGVPWRPGVPMGELTSRTLDLAAHLQKAAQPGEVAASWAAFTRLEHRAGFLPGPKSGPLAGAYCWTEWQEQQDVVPATPAAEAPLDPSTSSQLKAALSMEALSSVHDEGSGLWMRVAGGVVAVGVVLAALWAVGKSLTVPKRRPGVNRPSAAQPTGNQAAPKNSPGGTGRPSPGSAPSTVALALPTTGDLTWHYAETSSQGAAPVRVSESLSGLFTLAGQEVSRLVSSDRSRPTLLVRLRTDGLAVYGTVAPDGNTTALLYSPPYRLLPHPIPLGSPLQQEFTIEGRDAQGAPFTGSGRVTLTVESQSQKHADPAGTFEAYPFAMVEEMAFPGPAGSMRVEHRGWLAPAAGIIEEQVVTTQGAQRRSVTRVLESKSF